MGSLDGGGEMALGLDIAGGGEEGGWGEGDGIGLGHGRRESAGTCGNGSSPQILVPVTLLRAEAKHD
jgi:hypothetical protein